MVASVFYEAHLDGCFWTYLKAQNKWYNQKIGISVVNPHLQWKKLVERELDFPLIGSHDEHAKLGRGMYLI